MGLVTFELSDERELFKNITYVISHYQGEVPWLLCSMCKETFPAPSMVGGYTVVVEAAKHTMKHREPDIESEVWDA